MEEKNLKQRNKKQEASEHQTSESKNDNKENEANLDDNKKEQKPTSTEHHHWYPSYEFVFRTLIISRFISAVYNQLWDCDEVYNYWEPLHHTLYGHGFQTWEYAPQYGLRSYLYIFIHTVFLLPFKYAGLSKVTLFYMLRFIFAIISGKCEARLYISVAKIYGGRIAIYFYLLLLTSSGMFLSTTSFLPSSFVMYFVCLAYYTWLSERYYSLSIYFIALGALLGWPFVGLLGVPIAIDLIFIQKRLFYFIKHAIIYGLLISLTMIAVDSYMFGKFVFAPLNIVIYNVFPKSAEYGPDIYGREPISYYILNCLLNFNVLFVFTIMNPLLQFMKIKLSDRDCKHNKKRLLVTLGMFLWMAVFFTRPHKEERFLYPIYPLMLLTAAQSIDICCYLIRKIINSNFLYQLIPIFIVSIHFLISLMRIFALLSNYSAQMNIFHQLNDPKIKYIKELEAKPYVNVCIGKEWYRFTSSFFLPESYDRQKWRLRFLESDFKGQLPAAYQENVPLLVSTRFINKDFNDRNLEVKKRYFNARACDFLIDTQENSPTTTEYNNKNKWRVMASYTFIDVDKSKKLYRAFYIPSLYEKNTNFLSFNLLKRVIA